MANNENNNVVLVGNLASDLEFSHKTMNESFYRATLITRRLDPEKYDIIPITVPGRLIDVNTIGEGTRVKIIGQFRSFNKFDEERNKKVLSLSVFAQDIINISALEIQEDLTQEYIDVLEECKKDKDIIDICGYICKDPVYRKTPKGREITDLIVACHRFNKSDYLPCIAWGRNAKYYSNAQKGTKLQISGRIQSRTYNRFIEEGKFEPVMVFEVSIFSADEVDLPTVAADDVDNNEE